MERKNQNIIKRWNPLTLLFLIILLAVFSVLYNYKVTLVIVMIMVITAMLAGEGHNFLKAWIKSIVVICAICFVLQSLFIPGQQVLWEFWVFQIKRESIGRAIILCSRILGVGSAILLGAKLIDMSSLMTVLEKKGISPSATYILLSTSNIIPQMSKKMNAIMEAQKSRGIETDSNLIVRAKAFFPAVVPLLLNSLVSAEERAITMEARAFSASCSKTKIRDVEDAKSDKIIRILLAVILLLGIGGKIWIVLK
ncbi:energy-coupling factor transporter transmembrane protein EcfT [Lachnospiraceae bacterium]|uniref:energy-coupling factor transporter transmembrane component T n=1 Tax=Extibacter sp. GGCC_0201 TaxID=2731209 RepID=UPI001FB679D8|nr:energy-coupling factor transporter transmembrane component T [Extibacter sp. GGCC_0201]BDF35730.1 energy-coupling factor transporter transmembrane protein EcfT [Lachnospiraceae bacterium]BDF39732.1 energy-coupling factor transporter transmembrane protein EcfT [Lachnospiraceae bacterium]